MPVLNEEATILEAVEDVISSNPCEGAFELIIVDDGSTDRTPQLVELAVASDERVRTFRHPHNLGKGGAIMTALSKARGRFSTVMDADLEYQSADIDRLIGPLRGGEANVVFGARGFDSRSAYSFWYVLGNRGVTFFANAVFNVWLGDIMTCHKAMPTELFRSLPLRERGFAIEPEITARLLRKKIRIMEVSVAYRARSREEGKKLTTIDGLRVIRTLIRCRFF
ncbi:MAG: glycosyltransferase family 2 protein [Solirubrobacterales bacterium]